MAAISIGPQTFNVRAAAVGDVNATRPGSSFKVGNFVPVTDTALASAGDRLTIDIQAENTSGLPNSLTVVVFDPSGSGGFFGEGTITWEEGDDGEAWIRFTDFPIEADPVTATSQCELRLQTAAEVVEVRRFPG